MTVFALSKSIPSPPACVESKKQRSWCIEKQVSLGLYISKKSHKVVLRRERLRAVTSPNTAPISRSCKTEVTDTEYFATACSTVQIERTLASCENLAHITQCCELELKEQGTNRKDRDRRGQIEINRAKMGETETSNSNQATSWSST